MAFLENRLVVKTTQKTTITPGLVQMVNLLALNKLELVDMIAGELAENPVLEEATEVVEDPAPEPQDGGDSDGEADAGSEDLVDRDFDLQEFEKYLLDSSTRPREREDFAERPSFESFLSKPSLLSDHLEWQLGVAVVTEPVRSACDSIIGNLNADGYLVAVDEKGREIPLSLEEIAESGGHSVAEVETALTVVQGLDPAGVAARDLRECLLIQLTSFDVDDPIAIQVATDYLGKVQNQHFREIARGLHRSLDDVMSAVALIRSLDPRPGQRYNSPEARHIEPDVFFVKVGNQYTVVANEDEVPQLRLSRTYRRMLEGGSIDREAQNYVKDRFRSALQLLKNIEQRKNIIVKVCEEIIRNQAGFLDNGMEYLKPMMIKDVAEIVGVHPSTVSRAVANKYAHTSQGVLELRFFFSEAVSSTNGRSIPLTAVKDKVRRMIEGENPRKPLTDDAIAKLLKQDGIAVTRRSITKYREDLKIPSTHQRRVRE
jgi:RNA polymerase sigma-54 factor